jgi:hypothetical protein
VGEGAREEWRGDLFRSDLASVLPHLSADAHIDRPHRDTITAFYAPDGEWVEDKRPMRIRAYGDLPDLSPQTITSFLDHRVAGKLQVKSSVTADICDEVDTEAIHGGFEQFPRLPQHLELDSRTYTPHSLRVARRQHYSAAKLLGRSEADTEHHRVTLDLERHLFRLDGEQPTYLGDLGPRLEIKAPGPEEVEAVQDGLGVRELCVRLPYRSLELVFQDLLLGALSVARTSSFPEIEGKLEVTGTRDTDEIGQELVEWVRSLPSAGLLLPYPHQIVRMRRYYVCESEIDPRQWTVVETMGGKFSAKIKTADRTDGAALVRDTEASHSTDREGRNVPLAQFLDEHRLKLINHFKKRQVQVPFALDNGHAYLVKIDDCQDPAGHRLREVELETVGSLTGETLDEAAIVADTNRMVDQLLESPLGSELKPTTQSKHAFFARWTIPARDGG